MTVIELQSTACRPHAQAQRAVLYWLCMTFQLDINELLLGANKNFVCETYIFEPSPTEEPLGSLLAVAETETRAGVGNELLDLTITAIQREYYRDPKRGVVASFESALHQANLVLHEATERGVRDWMGYFNVVVGVLAGRPAGQAGSALHISVAGEATLLLARQQRLTNVSYGLSHLPITNPLRTFSQVASGTLTARDILFFGTGHFLNLFSEADLLRFSVDHSASTIGLRLQELYGDRKGAASLGLLTVSILPQSIVEPREEVGLQPRRRAALPTMPLPRKPLVIHTSRLKSLLALLSHILVKLKHYAHVTMWPLIKRGSARGGRAMVAASTLASARVKTLARRPSLPTIQRSDWRGWWQRLPVMSKVLAVISLVLAVAFVGSLFLLRQKRTDDQAVARASELLHEAQTKNEAVASALIYDNREQAQRLLSEADQLTSALLTTGRYEKEAQELKSAIQSQHDRLQKIQRVTGSAATVLTDLAGKVGSESPDGLVALADGVYAFSGKNNAVVRVSPAGEVTQLNEQTQGVSSFTLVAAHEADKALLFVTAEPGLALFDATDGTLTRQDIAWPSAKPTITSVATYGSRLYALDQAAGLLVSYSKSLRGYGGGEPWITNKDFNAKTIMSMAVDGSVFALLEDGTLTRLFKGEPTDFKAEAVEPDLREAKRIVTSEHLQRLYVFDPEKRRVVIFSKKGVLERQVYVDEAAALTDFAVSSDEKTLYFLDAGRVLAAPL